MKMKRIISRLLVAVFAISTVIAIPAQRVHADAFKVVTLGADLSSKQKEDMLKYFGVNRQEASVLEVTNAEEAKYLAEVASAKEIGTKSISCSYVEPTDKGGLVISTNNIYWVSESMIKNALITAGIKNATVKVSAPFNVSGTAALTGILKGFENSSAGEKIDENKKEAANQELVVTGKLGEKIGQDEAAGLINEVKKEVVKEKPKTDEEVKDIVVNIVNNYNYNLSQEDIDKIIAVMKKISSLNLDFNALKNQLNDVSKGLQAVLQSDEAQGFFEKIFRAIKAFFSELSS
ncbi:DUF1002 domain-containing protein [Clostridium sp. A1-XYC3]|uniref:DUF1002 domain-containing protein n=1 Tax=Clostridium tanneri TaxID=3037988 RepID=A0ABU4JQP9_9CLOT|nr:DUF1002 domain-containing protein [Clostridium sp. A1-XYC3]MDW8800445.1 DUF1002 domain-containing protein [Clostridium sp. A1-XYC3]